MSTRASYPHRRMKKSVTILENQTAAAHALKTDPEVIKRARSMNADGCLPGGRYDIPKLRKWIAENETLLKVEGEKLTLREQKLNEEIRKLRIANDERERKVVSRTWVAARDARLADLFKTTLYSKLVDEVPADMTNDVSTNRALLRVIADRLLAEVASWKAESQTP